MTKLIWDRGVACTGPSGTNGRTRWQVANACACVGPSAYNGRRQR